MEVHGITVIFFSKSVTTNVQKGDEVEPDKKALLGALFWPMFVSCALL